MSREADCLRSFPGSLAKQQVTASDQTDQSAEDQTDWPGGFVPLPPIVGEIGGKTLAEVYNNDRAHDGAKKSEEKYGQSTKYYTDDLLHHCDSLSVRPGLDSLSFRSSESMRYQDYITCELPKQD